MGHNTPRLLLILVLSLACTACENDEAETVGHNSTSPFPDLSVFPEAMWLGNEQDILAQLQTEPVECLNPRQQTANAYQIQVGRAAFSTPAVLGGQAARMGLSCNSCHRKGRDNPLFFIAGLSSQPGTVDVTHGFFSETREDAVFNPVPLPTLLDVSHKTSFGTMRPQATLEAFIHGVIVDEFAGHEPAPSVMSGLLAYVGALDSLSCNSTQTVARNLQSDLLFLDELALTMETAIARQNIPDLTLLVLATQSRLQDIHVRYQQQPELQQALEASSRQLRNLGNDQQAIQQEKLASWQQAFTALREHLQNPVASSLY